MLQKQPRLKMAGWEAPPNPAAERRAKARALYLAGYQQSDIAKRLGVSQARVSQLVSTSTSTRINKRQMLRMMRPPAPAMA